MAEAMFTILPAPRSPSSGYTALERETSLCVDCHDPIPLIDCYLVEEFRGQAAVDTGVVDKDIDAPEAFPCAPDSLKCICSLVTSARRPRTSAPMSSSSLTTAEQSSMSHIATRDPAAAKACANSLPNPRAPPVMMTVLSLRHMSICEPFATDVERAGASRAHPVAFSLPRLTSQVRDRVLRPLLRLLVDMQRSRRSPPGCRAIRLRPACGPAATPQSTGDRSR